MRAAGKWAGPAAGTEDSDKQAGQAADKQAQPAVQETGLSAGQLDRVQVQDRVPEQVQKRELKLKLEQEHRSWSKKTHHSE
jgi:hypothetical protein